MSLQRSACCRCAAFNYCPGLVSSQYLISIKCTRLAALDLCGVPCLLCNTWCEQGEEGEEELGLAS
eukprot:439326-Pelagomonas_calceolata.AAC.1